MGDLKNLRKTRLSLVVAAVGLLLGGCADSWNKFTEAVEPNQEAAALRSHDGAMDEGSGASQELPGFTTAGGESEAPMHPAAMTIVNLGREALGALSDPSMTQQQRAQLFHKLLDRDIDVPLIGRFVLGRYWREATPEQRKAYLKVYAEFILRSYVTQLDGVGVSRFEIIKTQPHGSKDFLVHCRIERTGAEPIKAIWRLRKTDDHYRIIDLMLAGVSMAQTQRQEFVSLIRANHGSIDSLIARLREKAEGVSRQASAS